MSTINYTQAMTNGFCGSLNYIPTFGNCSAIQDNTVGSFKFAPVEFESPIFLADDEANVFHSSLNSTSKKINKTQESSSHKRNKKARNPWTPKEDLKLTELMKKYGQSWAMISSKMEGRTGKQIRDRFLNKLRPNIRYGDWSLEEDELLVSLCKEIGNRWSLIATYLPGRTEGQVKNRFYSHIKKRLQPNGALSQTSESRNASEEFTSYNSSPLPEDCKFDFGMEFDTSMLSGCPVTYATQANSCQVPQYAVESNVYSAEEESFSDSTYQTTNCQTCSSSPFRVDLADPADVISYNASENTFYNQSQQSGSFALPLLQINNQVDANLNKDIDSFFADDLKSDDNQIPPFAPVEESDERFEELNRRKAYLEMALAQTLNEMKGL